MKNNLHYKYKNRLKIVLVCFLIVASNPIFANSYDTSADIVTLINQKTISLKHTNKSIVVILRDIQQQSGINYSINKSINPEDIPNISVDVENITVAKALEIILKPL